MPIVSGLRFGFIEVIRRLPRDGASQTRWLCRCDCGKEIIVLAPNPRRGDHKSCGCKSSEMKRISSTKHGGKGTPEYRAWKSMIARCRYDYRWHRRYAGRGIVVCEKWQNSFPSFLEDVGSRPSPDHSLDRYPNRDGNYEPDNVRWATKAEQTNNKGDRVVVEIEGEQMFLKEAAVRLGIPYRTAYDHYRSGKLSGWRQDGQASGVK